MPRRSTPLTPFRLQYEDMMGSLILVSRRHFSHDGLLSPGRDGILVVAGIVPRSHARLLLVDMAYWGCNDGRCLDDCAVLMADMAYRSMVRHFGVPREATLVLQQIGRHQLGLSCALEGGRHSVVFPMSCRHADARPGSCAPANAWAGPLERRMLDVANAIGASL